MGRDARCVLQEPSTTGDYPLALPGALPTFSAWRRWATSSAWNPRTLGDSEKPCPGSDEQTTWKASSQRPPKSGGSASGPTTFANSTKLIGQPDRKSTRLNSSHNEIAYAHLCS